MRGWWMMVVVAVGCGAPGDPAEDTDPSADTDSSADAEDSDPVALGELAAWDFEAPAIAPGDFLSWVDAPATQPAELMFFGDGLDVGRFHPLTAQLSTASPLAAPADGSHVVYINVQPWGPGTEPNGIGTLALEVERAVIAGVTYELTFAVAARLDLTWPDTTAQLLLVDGAGEVTVADAEAAMASPTPGTWRSVTLRATPTKTGDSLSLYVQVANSAVEAQQVLVDAVRLAAVE
jgi:hypothetical protein